MVPCAIRESDYGTDLRFVGCVQELDYDPAPPYVLRLREPFVQASLNIASGAHGGGLEGVDDPEANEPRNDSTDEISMYVAGSSKEKHPDSSFQ